MTKKLIFLMAFISLVMVGLLLTAQVTMAVDGIGAQAPTPNIVGTKGFQATPIQGPPPGLGGGPSAEGSLLVDPYVGKRFVWNGFPGLSSGTDDQGDYSYAKNHLGKATLWGYWYLQVEQSGYYDVFAYVPASANATRSAQYRLFLDDALGPPILVDQSAQAGRWANLGSHYLLDGEVGSQYIVLDNQTNEEDAASVVLYSTVYLTFRP